MGKEFKIVGITDITIRNILQNAGSEALALYVAYYEIATWQGTYRVKATTNFMAKRMKWSTRKVIRQKNLLKEIDAIADYQDKDSEGVIQGHYIAIKHLVDEMGVTKTHRVDKPTGWENGIQVLSTGNESTLNKKEVLDLSLLKEKFEKIRVNYKDKLQGKARGFNTEWNNYYKKNKNSTVEELKEIYIGMSNMYKEKKEEFPDGEFKYIPHFQTFINQRKWEEYL
jgi:hypothetical protein